jgi:NAD(P)-dependent dehydrogenase (short-subunit alcohol dehydrogenase family)
VEVHVRVFDAADEDAVKRIVSEAVEKYGRLDVFFANAGIVGPNKPFWSVDVEEFEKTQRTNVLRSVICTDGPRIQLIDVASS